MISRCFAGESQANRKYTAWAKQADREGHPGIARLFGPLQLPKPYTPMVTSKTLGDIKTTEDNLKAAMAGENYEVVTMYPTSWKMREQRVTRLPNGLSSGLGRSRRSTRNSWSGP